MKMPVVLTKAAVLLSSSKLPYSLSLSSVGSGHMSRLIASCSRQCCSRCSAVMMSALHGHISDSPTLNLLYMWALSLLCPVLNLNRMTCAGLFSLWRLSDWLQFECCCFHFFLERVLMMVFHRCKRCICPLVPAGPPPWQAGLPVHFLGSRSVLGSTVGLGLTGLRGRPGQFHFLGSRSVLGSTVGLGLTGLRGRPGQFPPR